LVVIGHRGGLLQGEVWRGHGILSGNPQFYGASYNAP